MNGKYKNNKNYISAVDRYKKKRRKEVLLLSFVLLLLVSIFLLINSSYVKIKNINLYGNYQLSEEDILNNISINSDTKYWDIKEDNIKNEISSKFNIVSDVYIEKKIFNTVNIKIKEKKIILLEKNDEGLYKPVLEDGQFLDIDLKYSLRVPAIENFKDNIDERNNVIKSIVNLDELVLNSISEIVYIGNYEAIIYMKDGQKIKVNVNNFHFKLNYYFQIASYIEDKKNTTLNLVNGVYLESNKTLDNRKNKIKTILFDNSKTEEKKDKDINDKKN